MKIKEFKQQDIKNISNDDLRIVLNTTFNKKIIKKIQEEFFDREVGK